MNNTLADLGASQEQMSLTPVDIDNNNAWTLFSSSIGNSIPDADHIVTKCECNYIHRISIPTSSDGIDTLMAKPRIKNTFSIARRGLAVLFAGTQRCLRAPCQMWEADVDEKWKLNTKSKILSIWSDGRTPVNVTPSPQPQMEVHHIHRRQASPRHPNILSRGGHTGTDIKMILKAKQPGWEVPTALLLNSRLELIVAIANAANLCGGNRYQEKEQSDTCRP
ncbi:uncharacterized protein F5147DRAFT_658590 [Suillus discolor]|uniref:Uncharacterized protein n=1 Tax=Suillus discolor TaxID=1912936 RepID=A0A9P7ET79_9AGAM|nr:uncharacterized protein F5147DRAFT_658590 [Suillus discolor]KAG2088844.1 hypothetical protein F5147DRAFT_658590 [Suillus discolor]